ncbi:MAG: DNA polymerase I [Abditibacteriota bacterium]|nr:DNA polymerase I [Abditibacteriota bacterium]
MDNIFLIDGNSLLFRAYFSTSALSNSLGFPTNALYGLSNMLLRILAKKPTYVVCAFDTQAPTFRHIMFEDYKAQRKPTEEQLVMQMAPARDLVRAFGVTVIEIDGYEADDIIGTIAKHSKEMNVQIWTGDLDSLQLIDNNIKVYQTVKGVSDVKIYDAQAVLDRYGVTVEQFVDFKGLKGDASDNIPGVPGIGDKTAAKLLQDYSSIDGIYDNIDSMKEGKIKKNLSEFKDQAYLSRTLAKIDTNIPLEMTFDNWKFSGFNHNDLFEISNLYQFYNLRNFIDMSKVNTTLIPEKETIPDIDSVTIDNDKDFDEIILKFEQEDEVSVFFEIKDDSFNFGSLYSENLGLFDFNMKKEENLLDIIIFDEEFSVSIDRLKPILENRNIKKIVFKSKDLIKILLNFGINLENLYFDTYLASYIKDSARVGENIEKLSYSLFNNELLANAYSNYVCYKKLYDNLERDLNLNLLLNVDQPLSFVLAEMERTGIEVNVKKLEELSEYITKELERLESEIYKLAGKEFNILSPKQLSSVLFEDLKIPYPGKGKVSTGAEILDLLVDYDIVRKILEYRELSKVKSTYSDALIKQINPNTGRVHTTYLQTGTVTGRLSSEKPNLQNIPNKGGVGMKVREAFIATREHSLISCDYSQIEFRIFAHITGDKELINAFVNGVDFHTATAMNIFDLEEEKITKDMRSQAKTMNFAILYGMGAYNLSKQLNISVKEANAFIENYFSRFPGIRETKNKILDEAKKKGYVATICNRRLYCPDLNAGNHFARANQERAAVNMPFQGSAADIMKIAMINIYNRIKKEGLNIKILLQVHDEIVCECPESLTDLASKLIKEEMEKAFILKVPLIAEVKVGPNWANMVKI